MRQIRIKTVFAALAVIMCLGLFAVMFADKTAYAASSGQIGDLTWKLDDSGTLTISGAGEMMEYYFEEPPWYSLRNKIKKIQIGEGVTNVGSDAFAGCEQLTSVTLADSVIRIDGHAFLDCSRLSQIILPEGLKEIGDGAFTNCLGLTGMDLPNGLERIGHRAFSECANITMIEIPDSVISTGQWAFRGCKSLTEMVLPNSLRLVQSGTFQDCSSLTRVTLPEGITNINTETFCGCTSLTEIVLPDNVWSIGLRAFKDCTSLRKITFSEQFLHIDNYAFENCTGLTQITLPENLTEIGGNAFENCTGLEEITFPGKVEKLGISAFEGCTGLKEISIPKSLTWIRDRAFYGCTGLTAVTIPNTVTTMDDSVFAACTGLTEVKVSRSTLKAGMSNIFEGCPNIKTIHFPEGITAIPDAAFYRFEQLTDITIPDTVQKLGNGAFLCCINLESITIPSKVTKLKDAVFRGCSKLETIIIPENVEEIGINSFAPSIDFSSGLKTVAILNKDLWIGENSFETTVVIYGYKGSTAETYAKENGLTFKPLLGITKQPANTYGTVGQTVKIKVTAAGYGPLEYQWYYRKNADSAWQKVSSAWGKKASYSMTVAERHDGYQYYCEVTNPGLGMKVKSKTVTLKIVTEKPSIKTQPKSVTVASKDKAVFKVTAAGEGITYQWYYRKSSSGSWTAVSAASGKKASYSLTAAAKHNGYQYYCAVTNPLGTVKSKTVTLTVVASKPVITAQPKAASVTAGNRVTFKITASGTALSYQWQYRRSASGSWTNVSAASGKTASYSLTAEKRHNGYQYRCIVKNLKGSVTSNVVKLTVK